MAHLPRVGDVVDQDHPLFRCRPIRNRPGNDLIGAITCPCLVPGACWRRRKQIGQRLIAQPLDHVTDLGVGEYREITRADPVRHHDLPTGVEQQHALGRRLHDLSHLARLGIHLFEEAGALQHQCRGSGNIGEHAQVIFVERAIALDIVQADHAGHLAAHNQRGGNRALDRTQLLNLTSVG